MNANGPGNTKMANKYILDLLMTSYDHYSPLMTSKSNDLKIKNVNKLYAYKIKASCKDNT